MGAVAGSPPAVEAGPPLIDAAEAMRRCAPFLDRRPLLVVSDFDGTLSPIVPDPWGARIVPLARRSLRRLAARRGVEVALLSGRTALDVAGRARVGGARYLGNHGLEQGRLPRRARAERLAVVAPADHDGHERDAVRIGGAIAALVPEPWLVVEAKGPAVAFHFRAAPDVDVAAARVTAAVDELDPDRRFVRFPGRRVVELRPPGAVAKGEAVGALLDEIRPAAVLVLGDDRSDAEAFATLRARREVGSIAGMALAVLAREEVPPEVAASADAVLRSVPEAARFLSRLAAAAR